MTRFEKEAKGNLEMAFNAPCSLVTWLSSRASFACTLSILCLVE